MAVKNTCTPANIYGGFKQTLFLGCSVMSFSASQGWNEQIAELTVQLVEDTCDAPTGSYKLYYDTTLSPQQHTTADPGFFGLSYDIIGAPVYFRVANFEFSGLVQGWEQSNGDSGNPTYQVKIVDPRQILEGTQVIINEYAGSVNNVYNLINAFGYAESKGSNSCPQYFQTSPGTYSTTDTGVVDGATFGSPAASFGNAGTNDNGMQWNVILDSVRSLTASTTPLSNIFSPYGRLVFRAPSSIPSTGMGLMPADSGSLAYYFVDLNDVPVAPSYWRLNGASSGLMDMISQICQDAGHDYYVELVPVVSGGTIYKFIKVRTVDRAAAPALNAVDTFVGNAGRQVQRYNKGQELRNEVTSTFVIGGPKQTVYQAEQNFDPEGDGQPTPPEADDMIVPFFGLNPNNGNVIIPYLDADGYWEFDAYTDDLATQLVGPRYSVAIPSTVTINERELIAARSGFDQWLSYASFHKTDLYNALGIQNKGLWDPEHIILLLKTLSSGKDLKPSDFISFIKKAATTGVSVELEIAQIAFSWISKIANEYYGIKYQVRVPFTCGKVDSESGKIVTSEEPSDGGWTEVTPVIGLTHPSIYTDFFTLDDGRLGAFCRFDGANVLQLTGLNVNDFVIYNNNAFIKVEVDPQYVYIDKSTLFSPRAIITLPAPIFSSPASDELLQAVSAFAKIVNKMKRGAAEKDIENKVKEAIKNIGTIINHLSMEGEAYAPDAVAFGIKSNVLRYGPWGSLGPAGAVSVTSDEGLVPWEYGGFTTLDLAGNSIASEGVVNTQVTEEGSVTVVGYPELPIGAELLAADAGGPFSGGGNNLVENRTLSTGIVFTTDNYYYTNVYAWDGTYGPNVTSITTQVSTQGATTTYNIRTWTPKFGIFSRGNAERIKQIGRMRLKNQKLLRSWTLQRIRKQQFAVAYRSAIEASKKRGIILNDGALAKPKTPHEVLMGQILDWGSSGYKRPSVLTSSVLESAQEITANYDSKAFMSLDGLLRPISLNGSGGLPQYISPTGNACQTTTSVGAQPPVDKPGEAGNLSQYNINHSQSYLNPLENPSGTLVSNLSDTANHGHDIEMLARGVSVPASSMTMPIQGYADNSDFDSSDYASDYRLLALRGPLLMQSWGYDLDGFPIPNKADTEAAASGGNFVDTGLQAKFLDGWLRKSHTWPVAPIDLRLDRKRGVWTIPQYRLVHAQLKNDLSAFGTVTANVIDGPTLYDTSGNPITQPEIVVKDIVGNAISSGDKVVAYFDPYVCEYHIVNQQASGTSSSGNTSLSDHDICYPPTGGITKQTSYDFSHLAFGAGLWVTSNSGDNPSDIGSSSGNISQTYTINAGFTPLSTSQDCAPTGGTLTTDGTRKINKVDFRGGLKAVDGTGTCDLILTAGIKPSGTNLCINTVTTDIDANILYSKIGFGKGLKIKDNDSNDCMFDVGAGLIFTHTGDCWIYGQNPYSDKLYSEIDYGDGLSVKHISDCKVGMSAGINPINSGGCLTGQTINNNYIKNKIYLYDGLRADDTNFTGGCEVGLSAGIEYHISGGCLAQSSASTQNFKNKINIMDGIVARDNPNDPCSMDIGAGLIVSNNQGCISGKPDPQSTTHYSKLALLDGIQAGHSGDCTLYLGAGTKYTDNSSCYNGSQKPDGTQLFSTVRIGGGLSSEVIGPCELGLSAGIQITNAGGCVSSGNIADTNPKYQIKLADGLLATTDGAAGNCDIKIGAGVKFQDVNTCVTGTPDSSKLINYIKLGKGLWGSQGDTDCQMLMGAGFAIDGSNACVSGTQANTGPINKLIAGKGLEIEKVADCEAQIGLYFDVGGIKSAQIEVGDCLKVTQGSGPCSAKIDFKDKYGDGLAISSVSVSVVTDINVTCCPSGGIESVTAYKTLLNFNSCGQLINMTSDGAYTLYCNCSDNYSYSSFFNIDTQNA